MGLVKNTTRTYIQAIFRIQNVTILIDQKRILVWLCRCRKANENTSQWEGKIGKMIPSKEVRPLRLIEKRSKFSSASPTMKSSLGGLVFPDRDFFRLRSFIDGRRLYKATTEEIENSDEMRKRQREVECFFFFFFVLNNNTIKIQRSWQKKIVKDMHIRRR